MLEQEKIYKKPVFGLKMGLKGLTLRLFGLKGLILRPQKQGWLKRLDFKPPQLPMWRTVKMKIEVVRNDLVTIFSGILYLY